MHLKAFSLLAMLSSAMAIATPVEAAQGTLDVKALEIEARQQQNQYASKWCAHGWAYCGVGHVYSKSTAKAMDFIWP